MLIKNITAYGQQLYFLAEQGLEQAKADGANYWYIDGSFPEEYPVNWTSARIDSLNAKINSANVHPLFHGNFKAPLASDVVAIRETAIKHVLTEIDLSSALSAPLIIHGGAIVEPRLVIKAKKEALDNYLKSLEVIIPYAESKGVTILLENLSNYKNYRPFHYIFTNPEEYKYVFDRIDNKNVYFFFDVGHSIICEGDPVSVVNDFHKKIWGMSFSNNDGVRDQHLGINNGIINYHNLVRKIVECDWQGKIAFEVRGRSFGQCIADLNHIFADVYSSQRVA